MSSEDYDANTVLAQERMSEVAEVGTEEESEWENITFTFEPQETLAENIETLLSTEQDKLVVTTKARRNPVKASKKSVSAPTKSFIVKQKKKFETEQKEKESSSSQQQQHNNVMRGKGPTVPVAPNFRVEARIRSNYHSKPLTSEERELQRVEEAKKAYLMKLKRSKKAFQRAKAKSAHAAQSVIRSTKQLTIPHTPVSHLMKRKGKKVCSILVPGGAHMSESMTDTRAGHKIPGTADQGHHKGPTIPQPFHFLTDTRVGHRSTNNDKPSSPVVLAAEAAHRFFLNGARHHEVITLKNGGRPTEPKAPRLLTDARSKASYKPRLLSREEMENKQMNEFTAHPFKARPVDQRIFHSMGELGVPKVPARESTQSLPFELRTAERAIVPRASAAPASEDRDVYKAFKARPMPSFEVKAVAPANTAAAAAKLTVPESPKLSGRYKASAAPAQRQKPHHSQQEKEKKQREHTEAARLKSKLTLTEPTEFHLSTSERGLVHRAQMEQQLRADKQREEAMREVKARPMPDLSKAFQPAPSEKELTEFKQFCLKSTELHAEAEAQLQAELKREEEQRRKTHSHFHAKPLPKSTFEVSFKVEHSERAPLATLDVNLGCEQRAKKRKEFDEMMCAKMAAVDADKEASALRKLEEENRRMKELRRKPVEEGGMCFKAAPVLRNDPYPSRHVPPATLTEPKSPVFQTMRRGSVKTASSNKPSAATSTSSTNNLLLTAALQSM